MTSPDAPRPLTFDEAIANVRTAYGMWESEFVVGPQERVAHERELNATIAALDAARSASPDPDLVRAMLVYVFDEVHRAGIGCGHDLAILETPR